MIPVDTRKIHKRKNFLQKEMVICFQMGNSFENQAKTQTNNNLDTIESTHSLKSHSDHSITNSDKKRYFNIKKYFRYEKILKEYIVENDNTSIKKGNNENLDISVYANMTDQEKVQKLKNLSKIVRRFRRKIKKINKNCKVKMEKFFKKHINKQISRKGCSREQISLKNLITALKKVKNNPNAEFTRDFNIIEDLISLILEKKLKFDSIQFKKIATQIRIFLEKKKIKHISDSKSQVMIKLPEKEVCITEMEFLEYKNAGDDAILFENIFGLRRMSNNTEFKDESILSTQNQGFSNWCSDLHKSNLKDKHF